MSSSSVTEIQEDETAARHRIQYDQVLFRLQEGQERHALLVAERTALERRYDTVRNSLNPAALRRDAE